MVSTTDLVRYLDDLLNASSIKDYCPNGLQVEGAPVVNRAVFAVTASLAVVEQAAAEGAQALLVHHGYFWRGEDPRVVGPRRRRLAGLLAADINLIGYHLPLDLHPELGNNAQFGARMGWTMDQTGGDRDLIALTRLPAPIGAVRLGRAVAGEAGPDPAAGRGPDARGQAHRLVHRRRPGHARGGDSPGGRRLRQRRDLGTDHPPGPRGRGDLCRRGSSRDRALRYPGARASTLPVASGSRPFHLDDPNPV